ncbi:hypothetical protein H6F61_01740 [Cyanobacteria bacterium FACHB-472]|nr:hypothetical protein [Cyanobacteria bacterium FACHB-472]
MADSVSQLGGIYRGSDVLPTNVRDMTMPCPYINSGLTVGLIENLLCG